MHHKEIKAQIRKQLKSEYPNWKSLSRKEKGTISRAVLEQAAENYDFKNEVTTPCHELPGLEDFRSKSGLLYTYIPVPIIFIERCSLDHEEDIAVFRKYQGLISSGCRILCVNNILCRFYKKVQIISA